MVSFGERLREERRRLDFSQTQFGALAGVTKKTQGLYESDERAPDALYLAAAAKAGMDILYVITGRRSVTEALANHEELLLERYRALGADRQRHLLAYALNGDIGHRTAASSVTVSGSGNRTAGGDYHE